MTADAVFIIIVFVGICCWYYGMEYQARAEFRQEQELEKAYEWAARHGLMQQPAAQFPRTIDDVIADQREQVIPEKSRLKTTTVNHDTGEIIEKWTTE